MYNLQYMLTLVTQGMREPNLIKILYLEKGQRQQKNLYLIIDPPHSDFLNGCTMKGTLQYQTAQKFFENDMHPQFSITVLGGSFQISNNKKIYMFIRIIQ